MMTAQNAKMLRELPQFEMREEERNQCTLLRIDPRQVLRVNIRDSIEAYTLHIEDKMVAIWGYHMSSFMSGTCRPWLFATTEADKHPYRFAINMRRVFNNLSTTYGRVEVTCLKTNAKAAKVLLWCGFTVDGTYENFGGHFMIMSRERAARREAIN